MSFVDGEPSRDSRSFTNTPSPLQYDPWGGLRYIRGTLGSSAALKAKAETSGDVRILVTNKVKIVRELSWVHKKKRESLTAWEGKIQVEGERSPLIEIFLLPRGPLLQWNRFQVRFSARTNKKTDCFDYPWNKFSRPRLYAILWATI